MSHINGTSHPYAFTGGTDPRKSQIFFGACAARDPCNAGISLRLFVSTRKILGTRAGTFATRAYRYRPMSLIYKDLLKIDGGERGIRTLEGFYTLHAFQACAIDHSATSPQDGGNPSSLTQSPTPLLPLLPSRPGGVHNMSPSGDQDGSPLDAGC